MDFNSQLSRMKGLMTYGNQVNEDARPISTCSLEYRAKAADGKTYGIIREGHRYYIKSASAGQEAIAESYQYLGGFNNKNDYMYDSYAKALKNFELKMSSINEACDGKVNVQTLNPFRANEALVEGTKKMKNEIARQRQIMYNAAMLMNEESGIGKTPITNQPESKHANSGDEDTPFTQSVTPDMEFDGKNAGTPKSQSEPYGKGGKAPKGKEVKINEGVEGGTEHDPSELADLLKDNVVRFTFIKQDGSTRHACGTQNIDIAKEWGAAIPTGVQPERPGKVPFIDLDMKEADMTPEQIAKGRYWKSCTADNVESIDEVISVDEIMGGENRESDTDEPEMTQGEEGASDIAGLDEEIGDLEDGFEENDEEDEFDSDELDDIESDDEARKAAEDDMRAEYGDKYIEMNETDDDIEDVEDDGDELDDFDDEDDDELEPEGDEDFESEDDEELEPEGNEDFESEEVDETNPESVRAEIERLQSVLDGLENEESEELGQDDEEEVEDEEEGEEIEPIDEAKLSVLNRIARKVAANILLKEERLNDFGKHPGYRKKPFELPETGEDQNEHGKDWNDESVYNEEPFGQSKGDSKPYSNTLERDALAMKITDKVMESLKKKSGSNTIDKNAMAKKITDKVMESIKKGC